MTSQMPLVLVMNLSAIAFSNKADGGPPGSSAGSTETQHQGCKSVDWDKTSSNKVSQGETQPKEVLLGYPSLRRSHLLVQILEDLSCHQQFHPKVNLKRQRAKRGRSSATLRNLQLGKKSLSYKSRQGMWYSSTSLFVFDFFPADPWCFLRLFI